MTARLCNFQVKSLLRQRHHFHGTLLECAANGGIIEMWAAVVDILRGEGLLEEVHVDEMQNGPPIFCCLFRAATAFSSGLRRFSLNSCFAVVRCCSRPPPR